MTLEQRAEKARKELFARYDQLNSLWQKAEEQFAIFHIPHATYYEFPDDPNVCRDPMEGDQALGVEKIGGKWRITYASYPPGEPQEGTWRPIVECSAETRVQAVKHLAGLRRTVVESAEAFIARVDAAIDSLQADLDADFASELLAERAKLNDIAK